MALIREVTYIKGERIGLWARGFCRFGHFFFLSVASQRFGKPIRAESDSVLSIWWRRLRLSRRPAIVPKSDAVLLVRAGHGIMVPVDVRGAGRDIFLKGFVILSSRRRVCLLANCVG